MAPSITADDNTTYNETEYIRVQLVKTKTIPTSKPKKELDIKDITSLDDLKSLKRQDPFMYYSIPGVRSAKILMKDDIDIDTANLGVSKITREEQQPPSIEKVTRCTRISYECGPSLLLEDILKDFDDCLD